MPDKCCGNRTSVSVDIRESDLWSSIAWDDPCPSPHSKIHPLQPLSEVLLPTLGQCCNSRSTPHRTRIVIAVPFCDIQPSDFRNCNAIWVSSNHFDLIASTDFSLAGDGEVETRPSARQESLHHVVGLKSHTKFVAREARLRHDHLRSTDRQTVAKMHRVF